MKKMVIAVLALVCASGASRAVETSYDGYLSRDSDSMAIAHHTLALRTPMGPIVTAGASLGFMNYADKTRSENAYEGQMLCEAAWPRWTAAVRAGILHYLDTSLPVFGASAVYNGPREFRLEASVDRSLVETFPSLDTDVSVTTLFAAADIPMHPRFLLIAGADERDFSDGNRRMGLLAKGIYSLPLEGLSVQVWHRQFGNSARGATGYFNPAAINFQRYIMAYRKGLGKGVRLMVRTGPGSQEYTGAGRTGTFYFEGGVERRVRSGLSCTAQYQYADSAIDNTLLNYDIHIFSGTITYRF